GEGPAAPHGRGPGTQRDLGAAGVDRGPVPGALWRQARQYATAHRLHRPFLQFDSAYAAYPMSIPGLFSMLCSGGPAPHAGAERLAAARFPCPSIAGQLSSAGYRTALVHSGRFVYLGMRGVVEGRGFDVLADAADIGGKHASSFGVDERSSVARALSFVD